MRRAQSPDRADRYTHCVGCRDHFYNSFDGAIGGECFRRKKAKLVRRWRLHLWTAPTVPRAFTEVRVFDCFHQPGKYAYQESLPSFAVDPIRLPVRGAK